MLEITVAPREYYDEVNNQFITVPEQKLVLEHSLISLSKWESKWHKVFLSEEARTREQQLDYIRCMTVNKTVNPMAYYGLTNKQLAEIEAYIEDPMTATWFADEKRLGKKKVITNEVIYSWMVDLAIPVEFERWHLNRLITLVRVLNNSHEPKKKMSKKATFDRYAELNAKRRAKTGTKG